jgi:hypothetical protein
MADLMQVLQGLAYVGLIAGTAFTIWQLYEMRRDRGTHLVLTIMSTISSRDTQELGRKVFDAEKTDAKGIEEACGRTALYSVGSFIDDVGYLVRRRMVDRECALETIAFADAWDKMKPWILREREKRGPMHLFHNIEYMAQLQRQQEAKEKEEGV